MEQKSYMLIVLKSSIDPSYAPVGAAHASLAGYLKWEDDELTYHWANHIFNKHIKMATPEEFEKAKDDKYGDKIVITESGLDNEEIAIVYRIKENYAGFLKTLPKWKIMACKNPEKRAAAIEAKSKLGVSINDRK